MASTTQKKRPASQASKTTAAAKAQKRPIRREIWAGVCFLIGFLTFLGFFKQANTKFISFICSIFKATMGYGFYLFPFAMFACFAILMWHHGRPVRARSICMACIPVAIGALAHLLICKLDFGNVKLTELMPQLSESGITMTSGGLLSGLLAFGLKRLISVYGAVPVFFFATLALLMVSLKLSPSVIAEKLKERERPEYIPEPEPEPKAPRIKKPVPVQQTGSGHVIDAIDIAVDDDEPAEAEEEKKKKVGFFDPNSRVKPPHKVLDKHKAADDAAAAAAAGEAEVQPAPEAEIPSAPTPVAPVNPTAGTDPLSIEKAAELIGIQLTSPEDMVQTGEFSTAEVREIRSPAKGGRMNSEELDSATQEVAAAVEKKNADTNQIYHFPPISLLQQSSGAVADSSEEIRINSERLQNTLNSFGVGASICDITHGPTVTRYDVELETGVKLAKLTNLAGDLALSLGVTGVRIAPIPDKVSTVGIEVPNKIVSTVLLRDIIDTDAFQNAPSRLTFALGKDIGGNAIVGNIAKLPHLLIAGTTGSGKSVCMNSLILSLLYKSTPEEVRLIMIDPKMVELGIYNGIPHLYVPVVTDPKKAAGSLQWSVIEMLKRYRLFSECGVRDLAGYNAHQKANNEPTLPQVVIVIDELADLMMTAAKEVEESICRVAQMGRAAGMHLVIATQRPSADVITGLMKANIPSRIAFAVSSAMESRIILDQMGAEKLVGMGDMLYAPLGANKHTRIQGAFVTDEEREEVVNFIKAQYGEAQYDKDIIESIDAASQKTPSASSGEEQSQQSAGPEGDYDELLPKAGDIIFEVNQASVSTLQRRLKVGYARAARLVDQLEEIGVVGPFEGSKPRKILVSLEEWKAKKVELGFAAAEEPQMTLADYQDDPPETWDEE